MRRLRVQISQLAAVVFEMVVVLRHYFLVSERVIRIEFKSRKNRGQVYQHVTGELYRANIVVTDWRPLLAN